MALDWKVSVEVVEQWRWRCVEEKILVAGSELWMINPGGGQLVRLTEISAKEVLRHRLQHSCGSAVVPVTPIEDV